MKKLIAFVMVTLLLCGGVVALGDSTTQFEPQYVNIIDASAREWFDSSTNRALLSILLAMDGAEERIDGFDFVKALTGTSYVIYDEDNRSVMVTYLFDDKSYTIAYMPGLEKAIYGEPIEGSELTVEMALEEMNYEYHRNSMTKIMEVVEEIQEILEEI